MADSPGQGSGTPANRVAAHETVPDNNPPQLNENPTGGKS